MKTKLATTLLVLCGFTAPIALSGCVAAGVAAGAAAGAAATDYFVDDNDVCNGPNDVGLIDSDCQDTHTSQQSD